MPARFQLRLPGAPLVAVFDAQLVDAFNDWTERQATQGFTWRPTSTSFLLPALGDGVAEVEVRLADALGPAGADAWRAIVVPFVCWGGRAEVSSIESSEVLALPSGRYALLFEAGVRDDQPWARLTFAPSQVYPPEPKILKADRGLDATTPLELEAEPARPAEPAA